MKCFLIPSLFLVLLTNLLKAQPEKYELAGTLKTENNQLVPFKLNFSIDEDGFIKGHSETNFYSEDRTKSEISGRLDFKNRSISFSETRNISTASSASPDEFCYIHVDQLPLKKSQSKTIFNGQFRGLYPDGSVCAKGEIYLVSMEVLKEFVENNKMVSGIKDSLQRQHNSVSSQKIPIELKTDENPGPTLTHLDEKLLEWQSNEIVLNIWDAFEEDNDRFAIYVNDKVLYQNEVATHFKKQYRFNFVGDTCIVKIVAENEGIKPPNTFQAQLVDGQKSQRLNTKLKKGDYVKFVFIKIKP